MARIWKDVVGFEGRYKVSDDGKVYSVLANRIIKTCVSNKGYELACLRKADGTRKQYTVHRIVASAFIPNKHSLRLVNHKDENKLNNRASNLEWCTVSQNNNYGTAKARRLETWELKHCKPFYVYDLENNFVGEFVNARKFARAFNMGSTSVYNSLCRNTDLSKRYSCHGYVLYYKSVVKKAV